MNVLRALSPNYALREREKDTKRSHAAHLGFMCSSSFLWARHFCAARFLSVCPSRRLSFVAENIQVESTLSGHCWEKQLAENG